MNHEPRVLLVCGPVTDERVWQPLLHHYRESATSFEIFAWPHTNGRPDIAELLSQTFWDKTFPLTIGVGAACGGTALAASHGITKKLLLIGGVDATELAGGYVPGRDEHKVHEAAARIPFRRYAAMIAATATGNKEKFAKLYAKEICSKIGDEHSALVTAMTTAYSDNIPLALSSKYEPWVDSLASSGVPTTFVYDTSFARESTTVRFKSSLQDRMPGTRFEAFEIPHDTYVGLQQGDELPRLIDANLREGELES